LPIGHDEAGGNNGMDAKIVTGNSRMKCTRHAFAAIMLVASGMLVADCTSTSKPQLTVETTGVTDEPATGYTDIKPGSEQDFILQVGRRVYFTSGSAELDDVTRETLDLQAAWLNNHPGWLVKLQGYADDPGGVGANLSISDKRANAVMNYLADKGVNRQRMWAKGYGKERQVRDCNNISCKALNRRVVVNLRKEFDEAAPQFKQVRG
jgi:peptidoglycan-associated lipoprotein